VRGSRLGLQARHRIAGSARLLSRRSFERATEADIDAMLRRLRLQRCRHPGCARLNLVGDGKPLGNERGYCERHRLQDIAVSAAREQAKLDAERARSDGLKKARGFRYKATLWIHRDHGDDAGVVLYFVKKPAAAGLRREAARRRSRILDDFHVEKL